MFQSPLSLSLSLFLSLSLLLSGINARTKNVFIAANAAGAVQHWHMSSGKCLHTYENPGNQVFALNFNTGTYHATFSYFFGFFSNICSALHRQQDFSQKNLIYLLFLNSFYLIFNTNLIFIMIFFYKMQTELSLPLLGRILTYVFTTKQQKRKQLVCEVNCNYILFIT